MLNILGKQRSAPEKIRANLTRREKEVAACIVSGSSNKEASRLLGISVRTVEAHRAHVMAKSGARNAADLVRILMSPSRPGER